MFDAELARLLLVIGCNRLRPAMVALILVRRNRPYLLAETNGLARCGF